MFDVTLPGGGVVDIRLCLQYSSELVDKLKEARCLAGANVDHGQYFGPGTGLFEAVYQKLCQITDVEEITCLFSISKDCDGHVCRQTVMEHADHPGVRG